MPRALLTLGLLSLPVPYFNHNAKDALTLHIIKIKTTKKDT